MRVLALDLSLHATGWALFANGEERPTGGVWELAASMAFRARAYLRLQQNIVDLNRVGKIDHIVWETPVDMVHFGRPNNPDVPITLHGLAEHCLSLSEALCIGRSDVSAATWRRHFIGQMPRATKGAELKRMAVLRCDQLGLDVPRAPSGIKSTDAAEAIGILDYKLDALGIQPPWRQQLSLVSPMARAG